MGAFSEGSGRVRARLRGEFPDADSVKLAKAADIAETEDDPLTEARRILAAWQDDGAPIFARSDSRAVQASQRRVKPEVVKLRRRLFDADAAPFPDDEIGARKWLSGALDPEHQAGGFSEEVQLHLAKAREAAEADGHRFSVRASEQRVWAWFEGEVFGARWEPGRYAPTTVRSGNPYYLLGRSVQVITEAVGGYALDWTLHVLTGQDVSIPATQVRLLRGLHNLRHEGGKTGPTVLSSDWELPAHVQVRMNRPLTHREIRELYDSISEVWGQQGLTCETCGESFEADRNDARYCSNACRQKAYRTRKSEEPATNPA